MFSFFHILRRKGTAPVALFFISLFLMAAGSTSSEFLHGIDVSRYQKDVNWEHVKEAEIHFAFMKATEGDFLKDRYFDTNWENSRKYGIKRGAYHFYLPDVSIEDQIEIFKRTVTLLPGDLAPVLDVETPCNSISDAQLRRDIFQWLTAIEEHYGVKPIIYTNQIYYNRKLRGYFTDYPLWIARYQNAEPITHPKDNMAFWQYSETGTVKGIDAPVDMNWFFGDVSALNKLCVPAKAAAPAPTGTMAQNNEL
ncbi:glycoside hydrolase family 25 protein [Rufibacter radiotolerans]|uniref:glycoside hydrolase family 25 protein n=1 Tax=Rufibacter radiotolerans TaxID=1379910 RepID=UPI00069E70A3|nr:GH25 family lysozyme [Rufibacter radiotolerans]